MGKIMIVDREHGHSKQSGQSDFGQTSLMVASTPAHEQVINKKRWPRRCSNKVNNQQLQ